MYLTSGHNRRYPLSEMSFALYPVFNKDFVQEKGSEWPQYSQLTSITIQQGRATLFTSLSLIIPVPRDPGTIMGADLYLYSRVPGNKKVTRLLMDYRVFFRIRAEVYSTYLALNQRMIIEDHRLSLSTHPVYQDNPRDPASLKTPGVSNFLNIKDDYKLPELLLMPPYSTKDAG
ncbi:hypothetical protein KQX54_004892 [Cotesia glomerata]|uniref:Uncharacterized protein n=1 Tax=Cotesia glomerata TaxID=32391 RepID=A0AAV7I9S4_COTGL|nr:hypothetical protein KQX54_004892 [Cotesia glomerata]